MAGDIARDEDDAVGEELNRAGVALALAGAVLLIVAAFLPRVETPRFARIEGNTLAQGPGGWWFVALPAFICVSIALVMRFKHRTKAVLAIGVWAIVMAVSDGTGERLDLRGTGPSNQGVVQRGSPGAGIYLAGAGGVLAAIGGAWILLGWGRREGPAGRAESLTRRD